jgi:hypothetical protein
MAMQPKVWMIATFFYKWVSHFITYVQAHESNLCLINCHLLLIDGHNSHVTADIVHKARGVGLDLINFPLHTSHVLQPLDVAWFKSFKTTFRTYTDLWILASKGNGVRKKDLVQWVFLALKKTLNPNKICKGFKATRIWPLNPNVW